jgi:hypothetical protein
VLTLAPVTSSTLAAAISTNTSADAGKQRLAFPLIDHDQQELPAAASTTAIT